jgi:NADH dehydrogenase/NADH:ubiquinone oxidoreductase subunit G
MSTITIEVNGRKVEAKKGETILSALRRASVKVPTLCNLEGLAPTGACRMCVVEVEGSANLVPSCSFPVAEGMKVKSNSPAVMQARRTIIELLLSNHPDDCLYCIRSGNCTLAELAQEHGVRARRFRGAKNKREKDMSGPSIQRDPEKCILCGKCVRVCEEIQGVSAIDFVQRGSKSMVGTAFNKGLNRPGRSTSVPTLRTSCASSPTRTRLSSPSTRPRSRFPSPRNSE